MKAYIWGQYYGCRTLSPRQRAKGSGRSLAELRHVLLLD